MYICIWINVEYHTKTYVYDDYCLYYCLASHIQYLCKKQKSFFELKETNYTEHVHTYSSLP